MSNILIQNATMVLPNTTVVGDLLIEDGTITAIQPGGGLVANQGITSIDADQERSENGPKRSKKV